MARNYVLVSLVFGVVHLTDGRYDLTSALFCQDDSISLGCYGGEVLAVHTAFYGRTDASVCASAGSQVTDCVDTDSLAELSRTCFGQPSCFVHNGELNRIFGNPCQGVPKYVIVEYECVEPSNIHSICERDEIMTHPVGYVTSDNYPVHYGSGILCRKMIQALPGQVVNIQILDVDLQYAPVFSRCDDRLVFMFGLNDFKVYCSPDSAARMGYDLRWEFKPTSQQNALETSFESSEFTQGLGFVFYYYITGCATQYMPRGPANSFVTARTEGHVVVYDCNPGFRLHGGNLTSRCISYQWEALHGICIPDEIVPNTTPPPATTTALPTTTPTTIATTTTPPTPPPKKKKVPTATLR